jgi:hypothetical protein
MKPSAFDFVGLVGLSLILYGVARLSPSAALIVGGVALCGFAFLMSAPKKEG